jgi:hypothetical protein
VLARELLHLPHKAAGVLSRHQKTQLQNSRVGLRCCRITLADIVSAVVALSMRHPGRRRAFAFHLLDMSRTEACVFISFGFAKTAFHRLLQNSRDARHTCINPHYAATRGCSDFGVYLGLSTR